LAIARTGKLTVNVEPLITTLQVSVAPIVEGQPEGASVIVSPHRLDLTLAGTFDQLQGLKVEMMDKTAYCNKRRIILLTDTAENLKYGNWEFIVSLS